MPQLPRLWIVSPVYWDLESYRQLVTEITEKLGSRLRLEFVAIDDTAGIDPGMETLASAGTARVITPPFNLGHQRALVFGLRRLAGVVDPDDTVVTMDSDGEDRPEDVPTLLQELGAAPSPPRIVLARRTSRHVTLAFRLLYSAFVLFFRFLTGTVVRTGNFAVFRGQALKSLLFHPHFDLCYSASLLSLNLDARLVHCPRGRRYAGRSKMGYLRLVRHGISMLLPFLDRVAVRALIICGGALGVAGGLLGVALIDAVLSGGQLPLWVVGVASAIAGLSLTAFLSLLTLFSMYAQSQAAALRLLEHRMGEGPQPGLPSPPKCRESA
ncbi:MAG: glycosyltransferase family 2 protein [Vicinamibacteria bacterium]